MRPLSITRELVRAMDAIEARLGELVIQVRSSKLIRAKVFALPRATADNEESPYTHIPVSATAGAEALEQACASFQEFYGVGDVSTKAVFRLPGAIAIHTPCSAALKGCIEAVNEAKDDFCQLAQTVADPYERFEIVHRAFPRLIFLQCVRKIHYVDEPLVSATFTWGSKSAIKKVSHDEVLSMLSSIRAEGRHDPSVIEGDIAVLHSLQHRGELRMRRDLKVRPLVNLRFKDGSKALREGHSPLILINPGDDVRIGELKDFDIELRDRKRGERITEDEPLLKCLRVYRVVHQQKSLF